MKWKENKEKIAKRFDDDGDDCFENMHRRIIYFALIPRAGKEGERESEKENGMRCGQLKIWKTFTIINNVWRGGVRTLAVWKFR